VEIIGGASRTPTINKIVKEFFDPVEVGSHINGDESMAFGGALRAANLSIAFRVKQLHFYDGYPEPVRAVVSNVEDGVIAESIIFDKDSEQGLKRDLVVNESSEDLKVTIFYGEDIIHEYVIINVSQWKQKYNESELNFTETPSTVLTFIANSITVAELKEAYVNITLNTSTTKEVYELVVENVTAEEASETKAEASGS
jgi:hypoxia up-regulated 1